MNNARTELLIGQQGLETLNNKCVTIVGVGGVGGTVAHALTRAGVGKIKLVDFDVVDPTNINRQFVAYEDTIGKVKVEALRAELLRINSGLEIEIFAEKLTVDNVEKIITPCDMVVDAIDSVKDKVALIEHCKKNNIDIISAMGAGNRWDIPKFFLTDIFKTHDDGLAKAVRKALRERGITSLDVVTCESRPVRTDKPVGSISYYPAMCGYVISACIINKFLENL